MTKKQMEALVELVDSLYELRLQKKRIMEEEAAAAKKVIEAADHLGLKKVKGSGDYAASVSHSTRKTVAWKKLAEHVGVPESVIAEFTTESEVDSVRFSIE